MCKTCKTCFLEGTQTMFGIVDEIGEFTGTVNEIYKLSVNSDQIYVTGNHYIKLLDKSIRVDELKTKDILFGGHKINGIEKISGEYKVFSVKNGGEYIRVGNNKILFADEILNEILYHDTVNINQNLPKEPNNRQIIRSKH